MPALVVGVLLFLTGGLKEMLRTRVQSLIFALGFMVGGYLLIGRLSLPPSDASEAFSWSALLLAGFILIYPKPQSTRYLLRGIFVLVLGALLLWPIRQQISNPVHFRNLVAFFCLGLGLWSITERAAGSVRPATAVLLPLISATAVSVLLVLKGSASFSNFVTILCALLGVALVIALFFPQRLSIKALTPFLSAFVVMFMAAGLFYLDINPWWLIFLALPYLFLWIREWLTFIPQNPLAEGLILGLLSAAPLVYFLKGVFVTAGPLY